MNWLLLLLAMQVGQAKFTVTTGQATIPFERRVVQTLTVKNEVLAWCYIDSESPANWNACDWHVGKPPPDIPLPFSGRHSYDWMPLAEPDNPFVISHMAPMDACKGGVYKNGVCLLPASTEWPAQDVPALVVGAHLGFDGCPSNSACFDHPVLDYSCTDKSRILLTSEDGTKHCVKF